MKLTDNVNRNLDIMFTCVNQTMSVEDDWERFLGEDLGERIREKSLII